MSKKSEKTSPKVKNSAPEKSAQTKRPKNSAPEKPEKSPAKKPKKSKKKSPRPASAYHAATVRAPRAVTRYTKKPRHLDKIAVPTYSLSEELINSISHGLGAVLALAALVLCAIKASTPIALVSATVYTSFMFVLYTISCVYHALSPRLLGKKVLRILDHINVLLMVAGTYTPICLALVGGWLGWVCFGLVWAITIVAIVFNAINIDKFSSLSVASHLILGWAALLLLPVFLARGVPLFGILLYLVGGGAVYSVGAILYKVGARRKFIHSVFHFFVVFASILQFLFIYFYCI